MHSRHRTILSVLALTAIVAAVTFLALRPDRLPTTHAGPVTIEVGSFWFCDSSFQGGVCETVVATGTTVSWNFVAGTHTSTECGDDCGGAVSTSSRLWHSGNVSSSTFELTFDTPGMFNYQCNIHPGFMQGRIIVQGDAPANTPLPVSTPTPTETPGADMPTPSETPTGPTPTPTSASTSVATAAHTSTPVGVIGDANGDGTVNAIDATLVLQLVADLIANLPSSADANVNGTIDAIDSALILQFVAGLLDSLPP